MYHNIVMVYIVMVYKIMTYLDPCSAVHMCHNIVELGQYCCMHRAEWSWPSAVLSKYPREPAEDLKDLVAQNLKVCNGRVVLGTFAMASEIPSPSGHAPVPCPSGHTPERTIPHSVCGAYVSAQVLGLVGTARMLFTYDSPLISYVRLANGAASAQTSITLIGSNFVSLDLTPTANVGVTLCVTTSWSSATQLKCRIAPGMGGPHTVALTLAALVGCSFKSFSFDAAALTYVAAMNLPSSGRS